MNFPGNEEASEGGEMSADAEAGAPRTEAPAPASAPSYFTVTQTMNFKGSDEFNEGDVTAHNVVINSSVGDHDHGSSKVKFKNIVDYNWEPKLYTGQLLAVHVDGKFLAYSIKSLNAQVSGKSSGMVRVAHRSTQKRLLLKGMTGQVHDLSFAYISTQILLACIDEIGNVFVHKISLESDSLTSKLVLHVLLPQEVGTEHRVLWCPYIPDIDDIEPDAEEDSAKLLLATKGNKAYIWNVGFLTSRFGSNLLSVKELANYYLCIEDHTQPIIDAAFSPDGTSLATASCDGFVMFFQIYMNMNSDTPRCLYKWSPHDGKPLSCIFFLDNRNSTEQFWKFVVTGAEKNSVLKVWSCQSWACLQTIIFAPSPKHPNIALKAGLDQSAKYLLLSDIYRRALFILHFDHDSEEANSVYCKKISEFHLPSPILCFGIVDSCLKRLKCPSSCSDYHPSGDYHSPDDSPDEFKQNETEEIMSDNELISNGHEVENEESNIRAVVRLYLIQPSRLQEGHITFTPFRFNGQLDKTLNLTNCPNDTLEFKDALNDISQDMDTSIISVPPSKVSPFIDNDENSDLEQQLNTVLVQQSQQLKNLLMRSKIPNEFTKQPTSPLVPGNMSFVPLLSSTNVGTSVPLNLMTPDAFSSKHDDEDHPVLGSPDVKVLSSAPAIDNDMLNTTMNIESVLSKPDTMSANRANQPQSNVCETKFASGGSSPSREVQEILSVKGSDCFYEEDFFSPKLNHHMIHNSANQSAASNEKKMPWAVWPDSMKAANKMPEANQRKSNAEMSDKSSTHSNSVSMSTIVDLADNDQASNAENTEKSNRKSYSPAQNNDMTCLISTLDNLAVLVHEQQKETLVLRNELTTLRRLHQNNVTQNIEEPNSISKIIDQALMRNHYQLKELVDAAIESRTETERMHREALLSGVSQIMGAQLAEKLNSAVAHETRNTLIPLMERLIEPATRSLHLEVSRKLTATDHLLAENIQKLVNNRTVIDNLSQSLAASIAASTKEAFKQSIQASLIPHLEKALSQMFKQLNQSFSSGTKEYLSAFENCTKRTLEYVGSADETLVRAKTVAGQLQNILDMQNKYMNTSQTQQTAKQLNNMSKDIQNTISNTLQGALEGQLLPIKECIKEQIISGMAAQASILEDSVLSAVRSGTQTPAPGILDVQVQQHHIEHLLKSGQTNAAFQVALSASDLKLVTYACSLADPRQVFCMPCPLQPNVLLSLIQQLSADMTTDTQLKCSYLGEAITYLSADQENPLTKEHIPMVLKELQKQLSNFLIHNRNNSSAGQLKLLLLATESLLKS